MELKDIIRYLRGTRSQTEFAESLGVSRQAVSQWEQGDTEPRSDILDKLKIKAQTTYSHG